MTTISFIPNLLIYLLTNSPISSISMDLQTEVLSVLNTFTDETWQSNRLNCFRWITTYFQLRLNFPFLNWLISRFYP